MKPNNQEYIYECKGCGFETEKEKCKICGTSKYIIKKKGKSHGTITKCSV